MAEQEPSEYNPEGYETNTEKNMEDNDGAEPYEQDIDEASNSETDRRREDIKRTADYRVVVRAIINAPNGEINDSMVANFKNMDNGISEEEATRRIEGVQKFLANLKISVENTSIGEEEKSLIQEIICEPILRGHISGETAKSMVSNIKIVDGIGLKEKFKKSHGYEGIMSCNMRTGEITIAKEALTGEEKAEDGTELDLRQMIIHEMSHVVTEDVFFNKSPETETEKSANAEAQKFSREIIELAQQSKQNRIPQSRHIEVVLDTLSNLPGEAKKAGISDDNYETFKQERESRAAREILTEYTAVFLKSDGTRDGFKGEYVSSVGMKRMTEYLSNGQENSTETKIKISEILKSESSQEKAEKIKDFPEMEVALKMYNQFYDMASKYLGEDQIKAAALSRAQGGKSEGREFVDGGGGFGVGTENKAEKPEGNNNIATAAAEVFRSTQELDVLTGFH